MSKAQNIPELPERVGPECTKKHNKKDLSECPICGSEDITEIIGWCLNHSNPHTEHGTNYCADHGEGNECGVIQEIKDAYMCLDCETMYDAAIMANWNWGKDCSWMYCPVGETVAEENDEA